MNIKAFSLLLIMAAFLAGAFIAVLDPVEVNWAWMGSVLAAGAIGLVMFRRAHHSEASSGHRLSGNMQQLGGSLESILKNLSELCDRKEELPVYEARFEIDRLFREDLNRFANARESMIHVFGMQNYADVMSAFAAGERYINRVWSASTDGYIDEVNQYLVKARDQFREADGLFRKLQAEVAENPAVSHA
ncbi:MAG: hypothetical protein HKO64_08910 [Xanthomonadales bacterium]|nr:hypothetical protein [Xanthomonadales bacterium]NNL95727.1 hypothetical protein [Xanthomonadales bacterium]